MPKRTSAASNSACCVAWVTLNGHPARAANSAFDAGAGKVAPWLYKQPTQLHIPDSGDKPDDRLEGITEVAAA